jgi:hypothetical protein
MKTPKHVHGYIDRHGKARFYLRRKGCARVPLPGLPWSPEFMAVYQDAMTSEALRPAPSARHVKPGTIASLVHSYLNSVVFGELARETKRTRKNILRRFGNEHGDKRAAMLKREHIVAIFTKMSGKRFAARNWLKTVRALMQFAVSATAVSRKTRPPASRTCRARPKASALGTRTTSPRLRRAILSGRGNVWR